MTKYVNLDEVVSQEARSFTYRGQQHFMKELSVKALIEFQQASEAAEKDQDSAKNFEQMVDIICAQFPTFDREACLSLDMERLSAIMQLMVAVPEEEQSEADLKKT